ncbi:hypothetical protein PF005_g3274 [Phytophthora fragariae]|uniref:Secreted protein n=1 Tax=Phytophthora fragariae TaxID=53985 RepID=A0A6A3Z9H4_9STRA|nr:hypothetical protein PF003_g26826 [Phytophthora fragariae]KAE8946839.1 hypothetical protein PF009_g3548 [Phytophthora fragariae]KAE9133814.1 hypothetical protein PF007_g3194 [Phytophthora fragariae]KAE9153182.1 hypothetical protein PF006_g2671 [Phytophthora fragariae]KAE9230973.1 hypothetical protein PF005_g3274 [Phytophthora fragariae]
MVTVVILLLPTLATPPGVVDTDAIVTANVSSGYSYTASFSIKMVMLFWFWSDSNTIFPVVVVDPIATA